jgi:glyoxylase I family protein
MARQIAPGEGHMPELIFHHVALACQDQAVIERYYTRHFGFHRARVIPLGQEQMVFLKSGNIYLELCTAREARPVPAAGGDGPWYPGVRHLAVKVDNVDAKLAAMGDAANVTFGPLSFDDFIPGWRTAWVADPEGNIVEISQGYVDQENPPPLDS